MEQSSQDLERVEAKVEQLGELHRLSHSLFKRTLAAITIIVFLFATIVTVLSVFSTLEVSTAVKDMKEDFDLLSSAVTHEPLLEVSYQGRSITDGSMILDLSDDCIVPFQQMRFYNSGDASTTDIRMNYYISTDVKKARISDSESSSSSHDSWINPHTSIPGYQTHVTFETQGYIIHPRETWSPWFNLYIKLREDSDEPFYGKLIMFYGGKSSLEIDFEFRSTR